MNTLLEYTKSFCPENTNLFEYYNFQKSLDNYNNCPSYVKQSWLNMFQHYAESAVYLSNMCGYSHNDKNAIKKAEQKLSEFRKNFFKNA